jgi:hypothetical protein
MSAELAPVVVDDIEAHADADRSRPTAAAKRASRTDETVGIVGGVGGSGRERSWWRYRTGAVESMPRIRSISVV